MDLWLQIMLLGSAALLVRVGTACYATGLSRAKNAAAAILRVTCDLCVAALAFWAIGAAILQYQGNPVFGIDVASMFGLSPDRPQWETFFLLVMVLLATPLPALAMAERSRF